MDLLSDLDTEWTSTETMRSNDDLLDSNAESAANKMVNALTVSEQSGIAMSASRCSARFDGDRYSVS